MQDQRAEGEEKWEVSQGNKKHCNMLLYWPLCYNKCWKGIQLNWLACSGCTLDFLQNIFREKLVLRVVYTREKWGQIYYATPFHLPFLSGSHHYVTLSGSMAISCSESHVPCSECDILAKSRNGGHLSMAHGTHWPMWPGTYPGFLPV